MLGVLLLKDLRRARRNPLPWLINLLVPLAMTALIGMVFGGRSESGALGRIRFAIVDEDKSVLSDFLRGASTQREGGQHLAPMFVEREEAMRLINNDKISAVLIIPPHFMRDYLTARNAVTLELIKNPAESVHPAVLEEMLGVVVTALNALARNFSSEFPEWQAVFEGKEDYRKAAKLIERAGDKLRLAEKFVNPPLVSYQTGDASAEPASASAAGNSGDTAGKKFQPNQRSSVFAYLLVGISAMFLLFIGQTAMTDLHREVKLRTFERYQTMHQRIWLFILGKVLFAVIALLFASAVMLWGGGMLFGIQWQRPFSLILLTLAYACFVAALFGVLSALIPDERRAGALNNIVAMGLGIAGGCAFPPEQLPAFVREHVTPMLPTNWFTQGLRVLQFGGDGVPWQIVLIKLLAVSIVLIALAAIMFRSRFRSGLRA